MKTPAPVTRRQVLAALAVSPIVAKSFYRAEAAPSSESDLLFVGTGEGGGAKGIYAFRWNAATGRLDPLGLVAETRNPSFLALSPDSKFLFAVNEVDSWQGQPGGAVVSYALGRASAKLTPINAVSSRGAGPCHLSVDATGRVLAVANYTGGSAASFQIAPGGRLSEAISVFPYQGHGPNPGRQEAAHAHRASFSPDNRFVLINDLGLDRIHIYRLDPATAKLTANTPAAWIATPGTGPRALRFHPNGKWAYAISELTSAVVHLDWSAAAGTLTTVAETPLLPEGSKGESTASEIVIDPKGHHAYAANRGNDFLATMKIDEATGKLSAPHRTPSRGKTPRHIALDPTAHWMLAADQDSNRIAVYKRDPKTGLLASNGDTFDVPSPQCLVFV